MLVRTLQDDPSPAELRKWIKKNKITRKTKFPPIHVVWMGEFYKALEGTHRIAASSFLGLQLQFLEVDFEKNKNEEIYTIIKETDGDSDVSTEETLEEFLTHFECCGEDFNIENFEFMGEEKR